MDYRVRGGGAGMMLSGLLGDRLWTNGLPLEGFPEGEASIQEVRLSCDSRRRAGPIPTCTPDYFLWFCKPMAHLTAIHLG